MSIELWPEVHCSGTTDDGSVCKARPQKDADGNWLEYCWLHDPERAPIKRKRRASTFGTVRRLRSGHWQASYWHNAKKHLAPKPFESKAAADDWLREVRTDIRRGTYTDPKSGRITVRALGAEWLEADPSKRASTRARDETIQRVHIYGDKDDRHAFGSLRIESVTKARVQQLVNEWVARGLAPHTISRQFNVVRAMFTYALDNDYIGRSPCRGIKLPAIGLAERPPLSAEDIAAIADGMPEQYRPMVVLGAVLGLRWGEVAALRVRSVDFKRCILSVSEQIGRDKKVGAPKSRAGVRTLTIHPELAKLLEAHSGLYGRSSATDLLFQAPQGGPLDYTNWRPRVWTPAVEQAGLKGVSFHDLRRAAATQLVALGVDVKTAQTRLGHADPRLTLMLYAQATSEADQRAADKTGTWYFGTRAEDQLTRTERAPGSGKTKDRSEDRP